MRKSLSIPIFAAGIAAAICFCVLSFVDIIAARAVLPGIDAGGNAVFSDKTYWFSIYELLFIRGETGSAAIFVLSMAVYVLTAVGCAAGIYICVSPRGQRIGKAFSGVCVSLFVMIGLSILIFLVCRVAAFALTPCF